MSSYKIKHAYIASIDRQKEFLATVEDGREILPTLDNLESLDLEQVIKKHDEVVIIWNKYQS